MTHFSQHIITSWWNCCNFIYTQRYTQRKYRQCYMQNIKNKSNISGLSYRIWFRQIRAHMISSNMCRDSLMDTRAWTCKILKLPSETEDKEVMSIFMHFWKDKSHQMYFLSAGYLTFLDQNTLLFFVRGIIRWYCFCFFCQGNHQSLAMQSCDAFFAVSLVKLSNK